MKKVARLSKKFFLSYRGLPAKKQYLEFFTALLSIPVLLTVIILNFNSLHNLKTANTTNNTTNKSPEKIFITVPGSSSEQPVTNSSGTSGSLTVQSPCKKELGPVAITDPSEKDVVIDNPVAITISYDDTMYCAAVWSYRINGGSWSDYDNKSIALYNLPQGNIKLDLKVKSVVANQEQSLTRNFVYKGSSIIQPTSPTSSTSAN